MINDLLHSSLFAFKDLISSKKTLKKYLCLHKTQLFNFYLMFSKKRIKNVRLILKNFQKFL